MDRRQLCSDENTILMRRVADGDVEAFERIYRRFYPVVKNSFASCTIHNISTDDMVQEVFTRLWQHRGNFREESLFLTYLLGIAKHVYSERLRQYRRTIETDSKRHTNLTMDSYHGLSQPEAELYRNELTAVLARIQAMLTAEQQQALRISQAVDVTMTGEAHRLGCSHNALRCRLKRARKRLSKLLATILEDK